MCVHVSVFVCVCVFCMCVCILIQYYLSLARYRISQYAPIAIHQNKCTLMERRHSLTISQPMWTCRADQVSSSPG